VLSPFTGDAVLAKNGKGLVFFARGRVNTRYKRVFYSRVRVKANSQTKTREKNPKTGEIPKQNQGKTAVSARRTKRICIAK